VRISIGFSTSRAWYSAIIRAFTRAPVSHTFFLLEGALLGETIVLEEGTFGWSTRSREDFERGNVIVELVTPAHPIAFGVRRALAWLGQRYDYAGLFGMFFVMLARARGWRIKNPLASPHANFCSEMAVRVLQDSGYPGASALDPSTTTPADLLAFLRA
jgi:hypothetical protein